jgi:hypothetical protein
VTTLRDRYPEMGMEGNDVPLADVIRDLDALGRLCRASTIPVVQDAQIAQDLHELTGELQQSGNPGRRCRRVRQYVGTPTRSRKRLVPAFVMAAAGVMAWVLVVSPLVTGGSGANAAAIRVLRAAAHTASLQPLHVLQRGQYAYTKSEGAYFDEVSSPNGTWGALVRTTREIWVTTDGAGRIRQVSQPPVFLAPGDRSRWEAASAPPLTQLSGSETYDRQFSAGQLSPPLDIDGLHARDLLGHADDPDALGAAIRAIAEKNSNPLGWEMLTIVGDILRESTAPPRLRASLYQVAATIPDIELVGTVEDHAGRLGTAVAASRDDQRLELIFDPTTSALLAEETSLRHSVPDTSAPPGTVIDYTLYIQSGVVSSPTATSRVRWKSIPAHRRPM